MSRDIIVHEKELRNEADELLYSKELLQLLKQYGTPHITGSYTLKLMTWRDLDIYLVADELETKDFFALGSDIANLLKPVKMSFRNERIAKTSGLPHGLYWGTYLDETMGGWKIDLWAITGSQFEELIKFCNRVADELTQSNRKII
jgi:hypothetical protein